jgi:mono/diheme cytochrome c family protein
LRIVRGRRANWKLTIGNNVRQSTKRLAITALLICALAASVHSAIAQDTARIEAGEAVYNDYCFTCHGERLVNSGQTFDLRRLTANDRARFEKSVLGGKGQMPPWKGVLTGEQIDLLWSYIRANAFQK